MKYHNRLLITLILTVVLHNQTFASDFSNFGPIEKCACFKFPVYFKLKGNIKKTSVITKAKALIYQIIINFLYYCF